MSYKLENLSVLAYSNNFTQWHYKSEDGIKSILGKDYFNDATDMLRVGDMIIVNSGIDATLGNNIIFVMENNDGVIETQNLLGKES